MSDPLAEMAEFCLNLAQENAKLQAEKAELIAAAETVIERWETPKWKEAEPTAKTIYQLRAVVERIKNESKHEYISNEAYDCMGREALP